MADVSSFPQASRLPGSMLRRPAVQLYGFAATLFLSALLLFSVQPMFAKMALPVLGGSPSVWAVSMCFFQAALLAGYGYAHALNHYLAPEKAILAHLTVLAMTVLALPIGLPASLSEPPTDNAYLWLTGILALGVGLPFFVVSASAPLLQAWFAKTNHAQAHDPYFLYGASNVGSLLALLAYPLLIEPSLGLKAQAAIWGVGFSALAMCIAVSGCLMLAARGNNGVSMLAPAEAAEAKPVTASDRVTWTLLALVPSGLMVAVTTYITTDLASAPFLWVIPLALFLVTFIVVFRDTVPFNIERLQIVLVVILMPMLPGIFPDVRWMPWKVMEFALAVAAFFAASLVCHRQLFERRPAAANLTEFYIWMSFGGVLGGIFAAIIAPQIFTSVLEFTLLLLASFLARRGMLLDGPLPLNLSRVLMATLAAVAFLTACRIAFATGLLEAGDIARGLVVSAMIGGLLLVRNWPEHRLILVLSMMATVVLIPGETQTAYVERSFFGTVRVKHTAEGDFRLMFHGTTVHGARRLLDEAGKPLVHALPSTYYHPDSPMALGLDLARSLSKNNYAVRAGVVGLGTGSLACYRGDGDAWRYFEIDPVVARIARDPRHFDFLSRCAPGIDITLGDARLTLAKEARGVFDYLVIDAFSSDSVPVHLLTAEALALYLDKIDANGIVALHVSNRYMDLPKTVAATVRQLPGVTAISTSIEAKVASYDASTSAVVFISRNPAVVAALSKLPNATQLDPGPIAPWTDDYSDVISSIARQHGWR